MPGRDYHLAFDRMLFDAGITTRRSGATVHQYLDRDAAKYGPAHRELDPKHDAQMVRLWISDMARSLGTIENGTATAYVRIGWGHVVLDHIVSEEKDRRQEQTGKRPTDSQLDWDDLYEKALRYYVRHGFHRTYYKGTNRTLGEKINDWAFGKDSRARA